MLVLVPLMNSFFTESGGKYTFPSTNCHEVASATTVPLTLATARPVWGVTDLPDMMRAKGIEDERKWTNN